MIIKNAQNDLHHGDALQNVLHDVFLVLPFPLLPSPSLPQNEARDGEAQALVLVLLHNILVHS